MPEEVTGGAGSLGAEEVAAWYAEEFSKLGYGGTLDYSQCYDMMHPEIAGFTMREAGLDHGVTSVLEDAWTRQERWMTWDGHTAKWRMQGIEAMPQGDPWGPLALNIYMWAGHTWVAEELQKDEIEAPHEVYMDDRTWAAATAREATWPVY